MPPLGPTATQLRGWGLEPSWSRRVTFEGADGRPVDWHVLDTGPGPEGTIVCVHGNPTWGYAWKDVLTTLAPRFRVIAVDQTGMGYSERDRPRRLADRITELVTFCTQEVTGPLILAAHDWGGAIAVGAAGSLDPIALILANTAVAKPEGVRVPPLIAAARSLVDVSCRRTPAFVAGTARMTDRSHRAALRAPYESADRRVAVRDFVADIPVVPSDPSFGALAGCAAVLETLTVPTLLLWGGGDPVFHDRFLNDLRRRIPHADVQRFEGAGHLVMLDEAVGPIIDAWLSERRPASPVASPTQESEAGSSTVIEPVIARRDDPSFVYLGPDGRLRWSELFERSAQVRSHLQHRGLAPGAKVAILVPPSAELLIAVTGVWRAGGVPVVADASGGLRSLRRLLRAQGPRFVIGTRSTLAAAAALRMTPGALPLCFGTFPRSADVTVPLPASEDDDVPRRSHDVAAIVHTSGATGPAKAVRYTHGALSAQRTVLTNILSLGPKDAFTTSFGPFMLLAPALGVTSVRPDFPVDDPSKLSFEVLEAALQQAPVTTAWLSPASARAIVASAPGRTVPLDLVMLAGAPISRHLAGEVDGIITGEVRAPYGMTECLPVTDGTDPQSLGPLGGGCTGSVIEGCHVRIEPLDDADPDSSWGEILVSAPWMFDGYDTSWDQDHRSWVEIEGRRFHRTGDVGYLDSGRLFHLGRRSHVITTPNGPHASVAIEEPLADGLGTPVAAVGVGVPGAQVIAVVLEAEGSLRLASAEDAQRVRRLASHRIAAVLTGRFPVDRRHRSKVDRVALGHEVSDLLKGR